MAIHSLTPSIATISRHVNRYECGHINFVAAHSEAPLQLDSVMAFLVTARDGTDSEAPQRRAAVRAEHLAGIQEHVESGVLQFAGALVDDDGVMCGSVLLLDLPDRAAVEAYLQADIYTRTGVWQTFEISGFRRAV